jgi:hypothetical protein
MELSLTAIHDIIHPTAAFALESEGYGNITPSFHGDQTDNCWELSQLNPKNRIDSLNLPDQPLWRIDGCTALGTQFYGIPLFMSQRPPIRVDVFIPEQSSQPDHIRELLDLDVAFHTKDRSRVARLGIACHIVRILQIWTNELEDPENLYRSLPFGSRIVFKNLSLNVHNVEISIAQTHYLERQLLSTQQLTTKWCSNVTLPPTIDIFAVHVIEQLHDSVSLVEIEGTLWILKALTSFTKYLYHELKLLLSMTPHPYIISRPAHLVTKKCNFGGKIAVIGFTLRYHPSGTMRDLVPFRQMHRMLSDLDKRRWSIQLASALVHFRETSSTFYPDLRLDNVVLSDSGDIVMVDFEQRGVWCEFASPEVNSIENIRLLAIDEGGIPEDIRQNYMDLMDRLCPEYEDLILRQEYTNPQGGYNIPWMCLSSEEEEAAEVYMLGRVLWCIYEGVSAPQRSAVWQSYRMETDIEFPLYRRTPQRLRDLIDRCTRGRREALSSIIIREGTKLVLRAGHDERGSSVVVRKLAREWWVEEIAFSEQFLAMRKQGKEAKTWQDNFYDRPTLREVLEELQRFDISCSDQIHES